MTGIVRNIISREPRYQIAEDQAIAVVIERPVEGGLKTVEGELVDISRGGAKLRTFQPVPIDEAVTLDIKADDLQRTLSVAAEVCWTQPAGRDRWWLGCSFRPEIPDAVLTEFVLGGYLERRRYAREKIAVRTTAKWELHADHTPVWLLDLSAGGFCLLSQTTGRLAERVLLRLEDDQQREFLVTAMARWQVKTDDGYVVGCEFANKDGYGLLRRIVDPEEHVARSRLAFPWLRFLWPWGARGS